MALKIGIVGLPNVGKSTLFNALTRAQNAESANYPFCTIEANQAVVPVPDPRVDRLAELVQPAKVLYNTVDFVDIAGLVKGASRGEGLGNKFLGNIRETDTVLHVVRCFDDGDVVHVDGSVDPRRDVEVIETELVLSDLQSLENRLQKLRKEARGDRKLQPLLEGIEALQAFMEEGKPASAWPGARDSETMSSWLAQSGLLSAKPVIFCANLDEEGLADGNEHLEALKALAAERGSAVVPICARGEADLAGAEEEERAELLEMIGADEGGLEALIRTGFESLGLASYFTAGPKEVRAWNIHQGWKAPQAAGVIHTDFEKGFIRAEVIAFADFDREGSENACKAKGLMRVEGRDYVVQDGDVMHFRFNV